MCRLWVGTKSMTGKTTEGLASGRAKKTGRVLINTFKINFISFIKTAGFFDLWGGSGRVFTWFGLMDGIFLICFAGCPGCLTGIVLYCLHIYDRPYIGLVLDYSF